jgi:hypothetical protein
MAKKDLLGGRAGAEGNVSTGEGFVRRKDWRAEGICTGGMVFTGKDLHERQVLYERYYDGRRSNLGG